MLVKDQIKIQMNRLGVSARELSERMGTSEQTVRGWMSGRSFPAKKRIPALEKALSFQLDFSEGAAIHGDTVEAAMLSSDAELFLKLASLPAAVRLAFSGLVDVFNAASKPAGLVDRRRNTIQSVAPFSESTHAVSGQNTEEPTNHDPKSVSGGPYQSDRRSVSSAGQR